MSPLVMLFFIFMFLYLFFTIFKIKNIILGLFLGNLSWILMLFVYLLRDDPLGNHKTDLEFIYVVLGLSVIMTVIRMFKYYRNEKKKKKLQEIDIMKLKDM